jgi:hypothetical protein
MSTPSEVFAEQERRIKEQQEELERDRCELERLMLKYGLVVIARPTVDSEQTEKPESTPLVAAAKEAEGIIRARGRPISINELYKIMIVDRGREFGVGSKDPVSTFTSTLITSRKLRYIKDVGWWIPDVPWPPTVEDLEKLKAGSHTPSKRIYRGRGWRRSAAKQKLFELIKGLLKDRTKPMLFSELFERVKMAKVPIGGTDEKKNLAVFLHKFPCFESAGRTAGWRYVPERDYEGQEQELREAMETN